MKIAELSSVPLQQASLCLDCENITAGNTGCLACGSKALLNIARTLSRPGYISLVPRNETRISHVRKNTESMYQDYPWT